MGEGQDIKETKKKPFASYLPHATGGILYYTPSSSQLVMVLVTKLNVATFKHFDKIYRSSKYVDENSLHMPLLSWADSLHKL